MQRIKDLAIQYQVHIILVVLTAVISFQGAYIYLLERAINVSEGMLILNQQQQELNKKTAAIEGFIINKEGLVKFINNVIKDADKTSTTQAGNANPSNPVTRPTSPDTK
jgi:D-alanyl-lipoteichoic acid acyltransferase DltB (MBOAT superfamily)